jgi:hypothetical protein
MFGNKNNEVKTKILWTSQRHIVEPNSIYVCTIPNNSLMFKSSNVLFLGCHAHGDGGQGKKQKRKSLT